MVVRRTIEHMKTRPRDERVAFAGSVAVGVMVILFLGWAVYFFATLPVSTAPAASDTATSTEQF